MIIKSHTELASYIAGKSVLHLNSLGKDAVLCLEWLVNYAKIKKVYSLNFEFFAKHPRDDIYLKYLKKRYPSVTFFSEPNPFDVTNILLGKYQSPVDRLKTWNHQEYDSFDFKKTIENIRVETGCDYVCAGKSRYESFDRANFFHKNGLIKDNYIYPLGFLSKKQALALINFKVHPVYKLSKSTLDEISYYKMRATFKAYPEFYEQVKKFYPLIELDRYRWERMLRNG